MHPYGTRLKSRRWTKLEGVVVGYGSLTWPSTPDINGDEGIIQPVYLMQIECASSSLGPACMVFRANQVEVVDR